MIISALNILSISIVVITHSIVARDRTPSRHATILQLLAAPKIATETLLEFYEYSSNSLDNQRYRENENYFDMMMLKGKCFITVPRLRPQCRELYNLYRHLFAAHRDLFNNSEIKIPKKIHQIWIGGEPPKTLLKLTESVRECHPDFEYRLWRDSDLAEFGLDKSPLFWAAPNWGERADILRYHILNKYGGVYLDMDIVCIKSFEPLLHGVGFVVGISNLDTIEANNAVIAAVPGHPVLKELLKNLISSDSLDGRKCNTVSRTGPAYMNRILKNCFLQALCDDLIVLPIPFFYPLPIYFSGERRKSVYDKYVIPESYCIHLWEGWWGPKRIKYTDA